MGQFLAKPRQAEEVTYSFKSLLTSWFGTCEILARLSTPDRFQFWTLSTIIQCLRSLSLSFPLMLILFHFTIRDFLR
jgi:hypothetical protein